MASLTAWRQQALNLVTHQGLAVSALYCRSHALQREAIQRLDELGIVTWEADIRPADRYLMERFIPADLAYEPGPISRRFIAPKQLKSAPVSEVNL